MKAHVFDIEGDGLAPTKIHCLCYEENGVVHSLVDYDDMRVFLTSVDILIGHNIQLFDIPVLERILNIKIKARLVDTLIISWYLEPDRVRHGLEYWGEEFGIPKPAIQDWHNLSVEEYIHRCSEDVKINLTLWKRFKRKLSILYGKWEDADKFLSYLEFKMDCAREQERSKWTLDKEYALESLRKLQETKEEKLRSLVAGMPPVPSTVLKTRPEKPFKKDGTYSVQGVKWFALLKEKNLPETFDGEIEVVTDYTPPNPASSVQVKNWLFSLGWKPATFKFKKEEDGTIRKIPQIREEHSEDLCPSVLKLLDKSPAIADLQGLGIINHRISILAGFLSYAGQTNQIAAQIQGVTNTLRFKHKTAVNLPKVGKPHADGIRGSLIARKGYELCGSDMSSLEDRLKQHFIYPYDPEYVKEMMTDDYDPHLSLAELAKEVTPIQVRAYKDGTNKSIKPIRDIFKNGNYACQYGAGPPRLALTANISLEKAEQVWKTYWEKNWAIKEVAKKQRVKTVFGLMWLYNPISGFWYHLKYEKDVFSTLIQGSASYVFDMWVWEVRKKRPQLTAQFHDEIVLEVMIGYREKVTALLKDAINTLNEQLKLNRKLDIDVQFGQRYSDIH